MVEALAALFAGYAVVGDARRGPFRVSGCPCKSLQERSCATGSGR